MAYIEPKLELCPAYPKPGLHMASTQQALLFVDVDSLGTLFRMDQANTVNPLTVGSMDELVRKTVSSSLNHSGIHLLNRPLYLVAPYTNWLSRPEVALDGVARGLLSERTLAGDLAFFVEASTPELAREKATEAAVREGLRRIQADDDAPDGKVLHKVQWNVCNPNLHTNHHSTKLLLPEDLTVDMVVDILVNARNSEEAKTPDGEHNPILLEETEFHVFRTFKAPEFGGHKRGNKFGTRDCKVDEWARNKRSLIEPYTKVIEDKFKIYYPSRLSWCVPLSVVLAKWLVDHPGDADGFKAFRRNYLRLADAGEHLLLDAGLSLDGPYRILPDLQTMANTLDGYQINCYFDDQRPKHSFGPNSGQQINLFFNLEEEHCWVIKNLNAFLARQFSKLGERAAFCDQCKSPHSNLSFHKCVKSSCTCCSAFGCKNKETLKLSQNKIACDGCGKVFWWPQCFDIHRETGEVACQAQTKCSKCFVRYVKVKGHKCGQERCPDCKAPMLFDHYCYICADKTTKKEPTMKRFYGDIETEKDETGRFWPNLLMIQSSAGEAVTIFRGKHCVENFLDQAIRKDSTYRDSYLIFHNLKGFDGHFVLTALLKNKIKFDKLVRDQDILSLDIKACNLKLRDSLLFVPGTALAQFPSVFKLDKGMAKGFFPHSLNTQEQLSKTNFQEDGQRFPPLHYFEPNKMNVDNRNKLIKWWSEEKERFDEDTSLKYVVKEELERYCAMDVAVLRQGSSPSPSPAPKLSTH